MTTEFYDQSFTRRRITVDDGTTINLVSGGKGPPCCCCMAIRKAM
ncbi:hypothetical protein ACFQ4K_01195 [Tistrella bauzanensis]